MNTKKYVAEAIGTFWLTFAGCGSAVIAAGFPQVGIGLVGVSLAFGLSVVAEGVETELAARTLLEHGCHRAQGYLLSRPVDGAIMESLFQRRRIELPFATPLHSAP